MFIKFTDIEGSACLVSLEKVKYIYFENKIYTKVSLDDDTWIRVKEMPEESYENIKVLAEVPF